MSYPLTAKQEQIRRSAREVCSGYPCEYWRELDRTATYPPEFVRTLTEGGWLAALIPKEYGGPGLGVLEASLILEEIHASGGNAAACHAQMYTMGVLARQRRTEEAHPAGARRRATAPAGLRRHGADNGVRHDENSDPGGEARRPLYRAWPEGVHLAHRAFGPPAPARPHHAPSGSAPEDRRPIDPARRPGRSGRARTRDPPPAHNGQPPYLRGFPVLVPADGLPLRPRAGGLRPPHRPEAGRPVPRWRPRTRTSRRPA